jgi:predicted phosphodiesterase
MLTAVVSDLHLGAFNGADVARDGPNRERLMDALSGADQIVLLGDLLELRERPLATLLETVRPFFVRLGEVVSGRRVVLMAGNHDHALAEPWLGRLRIDGCELGPENEWPVEADDGVAGRLAAWMPDADVTFAYPGLRLRPDLYATHGHYLDLHLTVPRLESIAAGAMGRITGRGKSCSSAGDYEAVVGPMYAFYAGLAQVASPATLERGARISRRVWRRVTGDGAVGRLLLGRVTIPGGVVALNRLGLGPFKPELTGAELRRSGLLAMGRVAEVLAPGAENVLFAHTHRPGPLQDDDPAEWTTLSGTQLWNSGNWFHESALMGPGGDRSPYRPGTVVFLDEHGPPRIENPLRYAAAGSG